MTTVPRENPIKLIKWCLQLRIKNSAMYYPVDIALAFAILNGFYATILNILGTNANNFIAAPPGINIPANFPNNPAPIFWAPISVADDKR